MEILEELKPKHIVVEGKIGNTKYVISDDYVRPREEIDEILRRVARNAQRALAAQHRAEINELHTQIAADLKETNN